MLIEIRKLASSGVSYPPLNERNTLKLHKRRRKKNTSQLQEIGVHVKSYFKSFRRM